MTGPAARQWNAFASKEPYFAVLTEERYRAARLTSTAREEFYRTGEAYVAAIGELLKRLHLSLPVRNALEYGCGVGRVALPLGALADRVIAVDVAEAMLVPARARAADLGVDNVTFGTPSTLDGETFDLVNCSLLLQRLPRGRGAAMIAELARRVSFGGAIVLQFPTAAQTSGIKRATRAIRGRAPLLNRAANLLLKKDPGEPFIPTYDYSLDAVMAVLRAENFSELACVTATDGELETVTLAAKRFRRETARDEIAAAAPAVSVETSAAGERASDFIDAASFLASHSIEELNKTAEDYFAGLTSWDFHLAKPFSSISDAPPILLNLAVTLQGAELLPGQVVLDYGAGTGWLSRALTQLGCRAVLLDVSPAALRIARELYERLPPIGNQPPPQFLTFNGRTIDLPDESVDRIICFDAFHHSADPAATLRELARILKPGGIAAFAEPGPHHSQSAQSQFEMRTYGVLENDVDIHAIWREAREAGFANLRLAIFTIPPFHVTLAEFDDFLAGGSSSAGWTAATRASLSNVRNFFLRKSGSEVVDSRTITALRHSSRVTNVDVTGAQSTVEVSVTNSGSAEWLPASAGVGGVALGCHLFTASGELRTFDYARAPLTSRCHPGETVDFTLSLPPLPPGAYILELDCVAEGVAWFAGRGSHPARVAVTVPE